MGAAGLQGNVEEESRPLVDYGRQLPIGGLLDCGGREPSIGGERSLLVNCEGRELLIGGLWRKSPNGGLWRKRAAPLVACYFIMNFLDLQNKPGVMAHICKHQHLGG